MLADYDKFYETYKFGVSSERALWNIARELSRKNDLFEIDMLNKTAEAIRAAGKSSLGSLHEKCWGMAQNLNLEAYKRIVAMTSMEETKKTESEKEVS